VDKVLRCDCGFEARAADEVALLAAVRSHAQEEHGMALTQDEALLLVARAAVHGPSQDDMSNREEEK
jgi:hypothetical protein